MPILSNAPGLAAIFTLILFMSLASASAQTLPADERIELINSMNTTWKAANNPIADLSDSEMGLLLGLIPSDEPPRVSSALEPHIFSDSDLPDSFDWRDCHGLDYITAIKDQANCGSCWAFGVLGVLEGVVNAYYNNVSLDLNLSEQDLVSCDSPPNEGCGGGWLDMALDYLQANGVANETCFPYNATDVLCSQKCDDWEDGAWSITGYENITLGDIDAIKEALITKGPLVVGFEVYEDFPYYSSGIYRHTFGPFLGGHAVVMVGYGTYDGETYWICKNSWADWGESGYFNIFAGECGIDNTSVQAIDEPIPPALITRNCVDEDSDGYCNWGLGEKPDGCPACNDTVMDCDDSNDSIYQGCGEIDEPTGFLNITSSPSDANVYVVSPYNGSEYIYRGTTPLNITLNVGERTVRFTATHYFTKDVLVNITENETTELFVELDPAPYCGDGICQRDEGETCTLCHADCVCENHHRESTCDDPWECTSWTSCVNGLQSRDCFCSCDRNADCTGDDDEEQPCLVQQICSDPWSCTAWGSCVSGLQSRVCSCSCSNESDCTGDSGESRSCIVAPPPVCSLSWSCSTWSECDEGTQTRDCDCPCDDDADCTGDSTESRSCTLIGGETVSGSPTGAAIGSQLGSGQSGISQDKTQDSGLKTGGSQDTTWILLTIILIAAVAGIYLCKFKKPKTKKPRK